MSITAFPVLARILKEGGLIYTTAGRIFVLTGMLSSSYDFYRNLTIFVSILIMFP